MTTRRALLAGVLALGLGGDVYRSEDVALLHNSEPAGGAAIRFRLGTVVAWEPTDATNVISVDGTLLTNLPTIASSTEVRLIRAGDVVAIHSVGGVGTSTMYVVGRITRPGTPQAASVLEMLGAKVAAIATFQATTSSSYTDLATVGPIVPDVLVGPGGRCLVLWGCHIQETSTSFPRGGSMSFEVSGATSSAATFTRRYMAAHSDDGQTVSGTASSNNLRMRALAGELLEDLNPGLHTFTAKYRSEGNSASIDFGERIMIALPV